MPAIHRSGCGGAVGPSGLVALLLLALVFFSGIQYIQCSCVRLPEIPCNLASAYSVSLAQDPPNMFNTVYFSESRGNDTGRFCTFEEPCQTLSAVMNRLFPPTGDIYAVYLTGHYNLTEFSDSPSGYEWDFFHIIGQPDCWPSNSTDCGASLPVFDSILVAGHTFRFAFTLENIIIKPNIIVHPEFADAGACHGVVEVLDPHGPKSATLVNSFIDVSGTNGCLSINAALGDSPFNPFQVSNVTILNVPETVGNIRLYVTDLMGGGWPSDKSHDVYITNVTLDHEAASHSKLLLSAQLSPHSTTYLSDMDLAFFMHNQTNFSNQTMRMTNLKLSNFASNICQDRLYIENCIFENVLLNVSGSECRVLEPYPTSISKNVSVTNSQFKYSTLFVYAADTFLWHNAFYSAASTQEGVRLPPVMNLHLGPSSYRQDHSKPGVLMARENFWGHPSGPASCCNPSGLGVSVLWLTDFESWCIDDGCTQIASTSHQLDASLKNQSWDRIPACYYDTICTPDTIMVLWVSLGVEGFLVTIAAIACIVISCFLNFQLESDRYKILTTVTASILLLLSIIFGIEAVILPQLNSTVNNVVIHFSSPMTWNSMNVLTGTCAIVAALAIGVLVVINRKHHKKEFYGLRFVFICVVVLTISMSYSGFMAQMMPMLIKQSQITSDNHFPDMVLLPLLREGLLPTPRAWTPWIKAAVGIFIIMVILGTALWQLLRVRDFEEVDNILDEIAYRSPLLGLAPGQLARGDAAFARNSRRLAWFLIIPLASIVTTGLLQLKYQLNFALLQQVEESIITSFGSLICITGFAVFYRFYYRVVLLWLHVALWSFQAVSMLSLIGFWFLRTTTSHFAEFPTPMFVFAGLDLLSFGAMAIYGAVVIKRLSPQLASGLNQNLKNQMDEMFDHE